MTLLGFTAPALLFALSLNNLMNGVSRPLFGWVSDWLGREMTMFLTFLAEGIGIFYLDRYGSNPVLFVILAGLVFFAWGNIFSIFPALTSDQFGNKYATTNYALLYTAKGCAAFFVPIGSILAARTGSWHLTLVIAAVANILAALLMLAGAASDPRASHPPRRGSRSSACGLSEAVDSLHGKPPGFLSGFSIRACFW